MSKGVKWEDRPGTYYLKAVPRISKNNPKSDEKKPFRIAVIGDSITYGPHMQFDDVFAARLERMLNLNNINDSLEVINYGVSGFSTSHEVNVAKKALDQGADLLILQITLNDPELKPLKKQHEDTIRRFGPFRPSPAFKKIISYWKTLGFVLSRLHNSRTHVEYKKYFFELFDNKKSWAVFNSSLQKISTLAQNKNVPLVAVIFPLFGEDINDNYPFNQIHEKIRAALDAISVKHVDLLKSYKNIPALRLQVIPGVDFHPNEIAHRIAAEKIYKFLKKSSSLPRKFFYTNQLSNR